MEVRIILTDKKEQLAAYIEQYSRLILTICYSMTRDRFDAEDLAQETFIAAYRNLDDFDGRNIKAWLTTIAANKCRDYLKSAARRITPAAGENFEEMRDDSALPEDMLLRDDSERRMRALCGKLKEPYQTTACRHFCDNRSAGEISAETGRNIKTVQTHIYRAKAMLRELWKEEYS